MNTLQSMSFRKGADALIPTPRGMTVSGEYWHLPSLVRIFACNAGLTDLAVLLAEGLRTVAAPGLESQVVSEPGLAHIALTIDSRLAEEAYTLEIKEGSAMIAGGSATGVAWGAATLLQVLVIDHADRLLPFLRIEDEPRFGYRGLMVDVARHPHTLPTLKKLVVLCWYYKIRYLQIHLSDVEAFTFPSTAFPGLATPGCHLTLEQWCELEAFAARHQVVLVPELDVPGHANKELRRLCPTHPRTGRPVINPVNERTFTVLGTLIDEILAVFPRTPFFHIGADEIDYEGWQQCDDCVTFLHERGLERIEEVYRYFIVRMNGLVRERGRRMIVWEGFSSQGGIPIPPDVIVQFFDVEYLQPEEAIALGHQVINSCWGPLYVVPSNAICPLPMVYQWHPGIFGGNALSSVTDALDRAPAFGESSHVDAFYNRPLPGRRYPMAKALPTSDPAILGSMMCSWEMIDGDEVPALRRHLAAMSERVWNPVASGDLADFLLRLESQDWRLNSLLRVVTLAHRHQLPDFGLVGPEFGPFITDLMVSTIRDDGPVDRLSLPGLGLELTHRTFTGDFCDLHTELLKRGCGTVYFVHCFTAERAGTLVALLGYDGPVRMWLNGDEVFTDPCGAGPARRDTESIPVTVRNGRNELVVALDADRGRAWGIFLRFKY